jgi:thiosulfate/3-mercaptopyruvate sulfurtransferase
MTGKIDWKFPSAIVNCEWLAENINNNNIRTFDCTTYLHYRDNDPSLPYVVESGREQYEKSHIPNSSYIDLQSDLSDKDSPYRFTMPDLKILSENFKKVGIGENYHIVLYSRNGTQWSARIWWMLRSVGVDNVSILDGGFNEWVRLGLPTSDKILTFPKSNFNFKPRNEIFIDKEPVIKALEDKNTKILNSLTEDIHKGQNPRYGRPGRIPNSLNIPFHKLLDPETGKFLGAEELLEIFQKNKISYENQIINYCGGGIAASLEAFVLYQLGYKNLKIYDNSLSEWAIDENLPMEKD